MSSFRIDDENHVHVVPECTGQDGSAFSSVEDLKQMTADWPMRRLADIWNNLPGVRPVTRFENRNVAVQRIWRALHREVSSDQPEQSRGKRKRHSRETKLQLILRMLRSPEGATLTALMKATRWQAHSVRGSSVARFPNSWDCRLSPSAATTNASIVCLRASKPTY